MLQYIKEKTISKTTDLNILALFGDAVVMLTVLFNSFSYSVNDNFISNNLVIIILVLNCSFVINIYLRFLLIYKKKFRKYLVKIPIFNKMYLSMFDFISKQVKTPLSRRLINPFVRKIRSDQKLKNFKK